MVTAFILTWVDQLMYLGIFATILTLIFAVLAFAAFIEKDIDIHELQKIWILCFISLCGFIGLACSPSPERMAQTMALINPGTKIIVADLISPPKEVEIKVPTTIMSSVDVGNVNKLIQGEIKIKNSGQ